jgi:hypothetical protein
LGVTFGFRHHGGSAAGRVRGPRVRATRAINSRAISSEPAATRWCNAVSPRSSLAFTRTDLFWSKTRTTSARSSSAARISGVHPYRSAVLASAPASSRRLTMIE